MPLRQMECCIACCSFTPRRTVQYVDLQQAMYCLISRSARIAHCAGCCATNSAAQRVSPMPASTGVIASMTSVIAQPRVKAVMGRAKESQLRSDGGGTSNVRI